jgi:tetratricopeptide (TPR) repeat protein
MSFTIRILFLVAAHMILIFSVQPVFSQEQNPALQQGIAEYNQENYEEAIDSLLKAISADPLSSLPSYYLGMTYKNLQDYEESKKYFRNAIKLKPGINEVYLELAEVNYQLGEFQDALDVLAVAEKENVSPGQTAYMKGLVLMAMGKNTEAVESFKNARELSPELVQAADYQMGLAYLNEGRLEESEERFNEVISRDPDSDMGIYSKSYLDKIPKKKKAQTPFRYYAGVHFQYDDNVVLKGDTTEAVAVEDVSDEDDYREVVTAGIEYYPETKGPVGIVFHYSLYYSNHHDLSEYDVNSHSFVVVPNYSIDSKSNASVALGYTYSWVDDERYLTTGSVSPTYTYVINKKHTFQTYLNYTLKEYLYDLENADENRDADEYSLNINWFYFYDQDIGSLVGFKPGFDMGSFSQNKGYFNLLYKVLQNDAEGENWSYIGSTAIATSVTDLNEKTRLRVAGDFAYRNFDNTHTVFDKERKDLSYGFSALLYYRFYKNIDAQLLYAYRRDDSNIGFYDYDRNVYSIGVELRY